jgi:hypothetical protein
MMLSDGETYLSLLQRQVLILVFWEDLLTSLRRPSSIGKPDGGTPCS